MREKTKRGERRRKKGIKSLKNSRWKRERTSGEGQRYTRQEEERTMQKDLRMQMCGEKGESQQERDRKRAADRESKGGRALTSKRAKRERASERARMEETEEARGPDTRDGGDRAEGTRE